MTRCFPGSGQAASGSPRAAAVRLLPNPSDRRSPVAANCENIENQEQNDGARKGRTDGPLPGSNLPQVAHGLDDDSVEDARDRGDVMWIWPGGNEISQKHEEQKPREEIACVIAVRKSSPGRTSSSASQV